MVTCMVHGLHRERERGTWPTQSEPSKAKKEREEEGEKRREDGRRPESPSKIAKQKALPGYQEEVLRHHHYYPEYIINSTTDIITI